MSTIIIIIRHGEKLHWEKGSEPNENAKKKYIDNHLLSPKGCERAFALIGYFFHRQEMRDIFKLHPLKALIAQDVDSDIDPWGESERPVQTLQPLASTLEKSSLILNDGINSVESISNGKVAFKTFTKKEMSNLVNEITSGAFLGHSIIVSWSHKQIPQLLLDLGIKDINVLSHWPGKRFDLTLVVERRMDGSCQLQIHAQRLLYGDKDGIKI